MARPSNKHDRREKDNKNNINQEKPVTKRILPYKRPKSNRNICLYDPLADDEDETDDFEDENE
ncbi:MAG TPA: hypothetical protein VI911_02485 [Patescibacteria group bacterium]|nr:hypothetical protein [Patescibacteria group bacterium]